MGSFDQNKAYAAQEEEGQFFDDGREIELLHFVYSHKNIEKIRGSPENVLAAIDEYGRTKKYLMNVGEDKGRIVTDVIAEVKPKTMVELGGYVGYSCILFGDAVRKAGGQRYYSLERDPAFAAVIMSLVDLAGLSDIVKVIVGSSDESIARLTSSGQLKHIDLMFLDHYKPAYTTDLKLCEELGLITKGSLLAADNVIKPGNPPYLEYVRSSVDEKLKKAKEGGASNVDGIAETNVKMYEKRYGKANFSQSKGNPNLKYESKLVNSYEPTGVPQVNKPDMPYYYTHVGKNRLLLLLSFVTLPISLALVLLSTILSIFTRQRKPQLSKNADKSAQKTILVTGVSMTKGLTIARSLAQHTPHRIIGADISALSPGRFSLAISKYFRLEAPHGDDAEPYIDSLLGIFCSEQVDLWISCSSVVAAVEDGQVVKLAEQAAKEQGRIFHAIQFREDIVEKFHEKDNFIDYIASLDLKIPESYRCTSAAEAFNVLLPTLNTTSNGNGTSNDKSYQPGNDRKFILKPIGVDDRARAQMMTLLPLSTPQETSTYVQSLNISSTNPFQLQQFIRGTEYCTHALVIRGHIKAFTCCPSLELLMHYAALPPSSKLFQAMLKFTETVSRDGGADFTGHLSFDFLVEDDVVSGEDGDGEVVLYPIECNPRAHTAVVLFDKTSEMAEAYMSIFDDEVSDYNKTTPVYPRKPTTRYYWLGHDVVTYGILPILDVLSGGASWRDGVEGLGILGQHLVCWTDGTLAIGDPWPFFVLYHVYWPAKFVQALRTGKKWSRVNVSTTKMFEG
ncbi:hypothetical protein EK21DRAFT_97372 [Setomelanomma holmii]|uniref:catechol O-methyltransferase n=1 Tax=Setomelanomma holmii TaxID=210430 RepID=A0A9P4LRU3_9PLEO|nr:hypothetical protein EK21DRAFT_97372 [Setomelanomma holmii]